MTYFIVIVVFLQMSLEIFVVHGQHIGIEYPNDKHDNIPSKTNISEKQEEVFIKVDNQSKNVTKKDPFNHKSLITNSTTSTTAGVSKIPNNKNVINHKNITDSQNFVPNMSKDILQSGALMRGFYVFVGLSAIVLIYFFFRSCRIRHNTSKAKTVKKYGVVARRSDMEMRHLELDEDDEESLFDVVEHKLNN